MLPRAKVIHCVRNPVDTCLSAHKQPLEGSMALWTADLTVCARYFRIYTEMMDFWCELAPQHTPSLISSTNKSSVFKANSVRVYFFRRRILRDIIFRWHPHSSNRRTNIYDKAGCRLHMNHTKSLVHMGLHRSAACSDGHDELHSPFITQRAFLT